MNFRSNFNYILPSDCSPIKPTLFPPGCIHIIFFITVICYDGLNIRDNNRSRDSTIGWDCLERHLKFKLILWLVRLLGSCVEWNAFGINLNVIATKVFLNGTLNDNFSFDVFWEELSGAFTPLLSIVMMAGCPAG